MTSISTTQMPIHNKVINRKRVGSLSALESDGFVAKDKIDAFQSSMKMNLLSHRSTLQSVRKDDNTNAKKVSNSVRV